MTDTDDDAPLDDAAPLDSGPPALRHLVVPSTVGPLRVVVDDAGALTGLYLPDHRPAPAPAALGQEAPAADAALARVASALHTYLSGAGDTSEVPLAAVPGTPFQRAVWAAVAAVPFGSTTTYAEIAAVVGRPAAHRAVGAAVGRNPRCLVVPCHRVVGRGGAVVGYAGGIPLKRWLLALEARAGTDGADGPGGSPGSSDSSGPGDTLMAPPPG